MFTIYTLDKYLYPLYKQGSNTCRKYQNAPNFLRCRRLGDFVPAQNGSCGFLEFLMELGYVVRVHAFWFPVRLGNRRVSATHHSVSHFRSFTAFCSSPQLFVLFHGRGCDLFFPLGFSPFLFSFSFLSMV